METGIVTAENLSLSFGSLRVLDSVSFSLDGNGFTSIIGPSGCGKTTLLHIITGIHRHYSGTLDVRTDRVSFVFQKDSLLDWRDALSNVLLPFELSGNPVTEEQVERASELLDLAGLRGYEHFFPAELSGGMRKRVEIARALVTAPELLVLDEPFSALDIITREKLNVLVKRIHRVSGTAAILVTHSVEEACFLSDRIFIMSKRPGRIVQEYRIPERGSSEYDGFRLTQKEIDVGDGIRESARFLWMEDEIPDGRRDRGPEVRTVAGGRENALRVPAIRSAVPDHASGRYGTARTPRQAAPADREDRSGKNTSGGSQPKSGRKNGGSRNGISDVNRNYFFIPLELAAAFFLLTWAKGTFSIPDVVLPYPGDVLRRFYLTLSSGEILPDLFMTILESLSGFFTAFAVTLVLGYVIAKSRLLSDLLMPYLIAANTIPSVALAPFLVLWFGFGLTPRIITSIIVIFFPMLISTTSAIRLASESMKDLLSFYKPSWSLSFRKFEFPAALPVIWSGIKISITLSVIGAVVGEFVSGNVGLGALVSRAKAMFDVELMFVGLLWLVLLGIAYYGAANFIYLSIMKRRRKNPAKLPGE